MKKSAKKNVAHMYQSLAVLAGEMGFVGEARAWFRQGTATVRVRCLPASACFLCSSVCTATVGPKQFDLMTLEMASVLGKGAQCLWLPAC